jgi:hypothetical protein
MKTMSPCVAPPCLGNTDGDDTLPRVGRPPPGSSLIPLLPLLCLALVLIGCKDSSAQGKADASTQQTASVRDADVPLGTLAGDVPAPVQVQQNLLEGEVDVSNRYSSTVLIEANPSTTEAGALKCSGLLVAPRLVLTAGHCVCSQHKTETSSNPGGNIIDRSACASTATITAMTYQQQRPGENLRAMHERHRGEVHPHPELRIVLDPQGNITAIHANLAVILLEEPVPELASPPKLAESEVQPEEPVITVGYGNDGSGPELYGQRRFNKGRVVRLAENHEQIFLTPPKRFLYENDSGGPCLRESPQGDVLVGISNRGLGNESNCLSTYFHREWLRREILKADQPR